MNGVLEELAARMGCMYLSDLTEKPFQEIQRTISDLSINQYSAKEWVDAVQYLTNQIHDHGQTAQYLLRKHSELPITKQEKLEVKENGRYCGKYK